MAKAAEEREAKQAEAAKAEEAAGASFAHLYGDAPLINSSELTEKRWENVKNLTVDLAGQTVWLRAYLANSRKVGKGVFVVLRQGFCTAQATLWQGDKVPKSMVSYAASITKESVVDILGTVVVPEAPVTGCTQSGIEIVIQEVHTISKVRCVAPSVSRCVARARTALRRRVSRCVARARTALPRRSLAVSPPPAPRQL